jgi:hypothetical protein
MALRGVMFHTARIYLAQSPVGSPEEARKAVEAFQTTTAGLRLLRRQTGQPLPDTGRFALQALLEQARLPTWRLWARDAAIEKKDVMKARGYAWSPGEFGRPRC